MKFVMTLNMATTLFRTCNDIEFEIDANAKHHCFDFACPNFHMFNPWVLLKSILKVTSCATMSERVVVQSCIAFKRCSMSKCHMFPHSVSLLCLYMLGATWNVRGNIVSVSFLLYIELH